MVDGHVLLRLAKKENLGLLGITELHQARVLGGIDKLARDHAESQQQMSSGAAGDEKTQEPGASMTAVIDRAARWLGMGLITRPEFDAIKHALAVSNQTGRMGGTGRQLQSDADGMCASPDRMLRCYRV
eukprot:SAG22_NODE_14071_length_385_cov_1.262238_1_plen_128_part_11